MDHFVQFYSKDPSIVSRTIAGEVILVPIRQNTGDMESIYTLNETAAFVWDLFDGQHSLEAIQDQLVGEFAVDPDEARQDLLELTTMLKGIGAIVEA